MKLYKTTGVHKDLDQPNEVSWQASQTDASKARTALKASGRKATSATVEVPTSKGGLLDWLNENVKV